jgi:hypothetical protein
MTLRDVLRTRGLAMSLFAGLAIALAPVQALAQPAPTKAAQQQPPSSKPDDKPARKQPTRIKPPEKKETNSPESAPSAMVGAGSIPLGPYVRRAEHRDLLLNVEVSVFSDNAGMKETHADPQTGKSVDMPKVTPFEIRTLRMIFPMVKRTATSDMLGKVQPWEEVAGGDLGFRGRLLVAEQLVDFEPEQLEPNEITTYAAWDFAADPPSSAREVKLRVQYPLRAYATDFDEDGAMLVPWPKNWPREAQKAMEPQLYIESGVDDKGQIANYDKKPITEALKVMLAAEGIKDPASSTPVRVAKAITGQVWRTVSISGDGIERRRRTGEFMGLSVQAPSITLSTGKGSPQDAVALLVALLREAGIPARPLVGVDTGGNDDAFLSSSKDKRKAHSWVEFYLYDEAKGTHNWVPIDIAKMRRSSPRPPKFDSKWRGFGGAPDMDAVAPFAVAFHPPQQGIAAYGAAGFWGWFVTPTTPAQAEQVIEFTVGGVPRRTGSDLVPTSDSKDPQKKPDSRRDRNR